MYVLMTSRQDTAIVEDIDFCSKFFLENRFEFSENWSIKKSNEN